jgi:hypothetical protein
VQQGYPDCGARSEDQHNQAPSFGCRTSLPISVPRRQLRDNLLPGSGASATGPFWTLDLRKLIVLHARNNRKLLRPLHLLITGESGESKTHADDGCEFDGCTIPICGFCVWGQRTARREVCERGWNVRRSGFPAHSFVHEPQPTTTNHRVIELIRVHLMRNVMGLALKAPKLT